MTKPDPAAEAAYFDGLTLAVEPDNTPAPRTAAGVRARQRAFNEGRLMTAAVGAKAMANNERDAARGAKAADPVPETVTDSAPEMAADGEPLLD